MGFIPSCHAVFPQLAWNEHSATANFRIYASQRDRQSQIWDISVLAMLIRETLVKLDFTSWMLVPPGTPLVANLGHLWQLISFFMPHLYSTSSWNSAGAVWRLYEADVVVKPTFWRKLHGISYISRFNLNSAAPSHFYSHFKQLDGSQIFIWLEVVNLYAVRDVIECACGVPYCVFSDGALRNLGTRNWLPLNVIFANTCLIVISERDNQKLIVCDYLSCP